jgi:hypothetical protein
LVLFGGVRVKKNNNKITNEFLNDIYIYSLTDKLWRFIKPTGTVPE